MKEGGREGRAVGAEWRWRENRGKRCRILRCYFLVFLICFLGKAAFSAGWVWLVLVDVGVTNGYRGWELRNISSIGVLKFSKQWFLCAYRKWLVGIGCVGKGPDILAV